MDILRQTPTFDWILYLPKYSKCTVCCSIYSYNHTPKFFNEITLVVKIHELGNAEQEKFIGELKRVAFGWCGIMNFTPRDSHYNYPDDELTTDSQKRWNAYLLSVSPSMITSNSSENFFKEQSIFKARCAVNIMLPLRSINYLGVIYDNSSYRGDQKRSSVTLPLFCDTGTSIRSSLVAINPTVSSLYLSGLLSELDPIIIYPSSAVEIDLSKSVPKDTKLKVLSWSNDGGIALSVHRLAADGEVILVDYL